MYIVAFILCLKKNKLHAYWFLQKKNFVSEFHTELLVCLQFPKFQVHLMISI